MSPTRIAALIVAAFFIGAITLFQLSNQGTSTVETASGSSDATNQATTAPPTTVALDRAPENFGPMPELQEDELDGWLQTDGDSFETVRGEVTIVKFWTFGCFNCKNTVPHIREIYERHQDNGLEIIGIHSPEFEREKDVGRIQQAAVDQNIPWPIALDTEKKNFRSWQGSRRFWPRTYVIDQNGDVRYDKIGEGKYDELEATVAYLLENGA